MSHVSRMSHMSCDRVGWISREAVVRLWECGQGSRKRGIRLFEFVGAVTCELWPVHRMRPSVTGSTELCVFSCTLLKTV